MCTRWKRRTSYHIVCNHPFVDGNKRAGTAAALVFLELHGVQVDMDGDALDALVLSVAEGRTLKPEVANALRLHAVPSRPWCLS